MIMGRDQPKIIIIENRFLSVKPSLINLENTKSCIKIGNAIVFLTAHIKKGAALVTISLLFV